MVDYPYKDSRNGKDCTQRFDNDAVLEMRLEKTGHGIHAWIEAQK